MSLILRHNPSAIGLSLDEHGWANLDELIEAANQSGKHLSRDLVIQVVHENDKQRFTLNDDGTRIRANQGHSIKIDLDLRPVSPPEFVYHGTVKCFLIPIMNEGLKSGSRQHVHLSSDTKTAKSVARRRGVPIILKVHSQIMHRDGFEFYHSWNGVWLTHHVPAKYLQNPEES